MMPWRSAYLIEALKQKAQARLVEEPNVSKRLRTELVPGQPPLPTRLMAGLTILKYTHDLSDEVLCERWVENPYYQFFCGEEFFQHKLVLDRSSLTRWRQRMGEERLQALLQESLSVATRTEAIKPSDLNRVIVDTTVQPKTVMFPTDGPAAQPCS